AVDASPAIRAVGKRELLARGTKVQPALQALKVQDLRQLGVVSKGIDTVADGRLPPEARTEVTLGVEPLTDERLAAGEVIVRLDQPAPSELPAAIRNPLADARE